MQCSSQACLGRTWSLTSASTRSVAGNTRLVEAVRGRRTSRGLGTRLRRVGRARNASWPSTPRNYKEGLRRCLGSQPHTPPPHPPFRAQPMTNMEGQRYTPHPKSPANSPPLPLLDSPELLGSPSKLPRRERVKSFVKQVVRRVSSTTKEPRHRTPSPSLSGRRRESSSYHHLSAEHDAPREGHDDGEDYFALQAAASPRSGRSPRHARTRTTSTTSIKSTDSMAQRFRRKLSASTGSSAQTPSLDSRSTAESEGVRSEHTHEHEPPVSLAFPQVVESPEEFGAVERKAPAPLLSVPPSIELEEATPVAPTPLARISLPMPLLSPPAEEAEGPNPFVVQQSKQATPAGSDTAVVENPPLESVVVDNAPSESAAVENPPPTSAAVEDPPMEDAAVETVPAPHIEESLSSTGAPLPTEVDVAPPAEQPPAPLPAPPLPAEVVPAPSPLRTAPSLPPPTAINIPTAAPASPAARAPADESRGDKLPPLFVRTLILPQLVLPVPNVRRLVYLWHKHAPTYFHPHRPGASWLLLPAVLFAVGVYRNHRRA